MTTIKSYTDLEQSKVLAKILPLESADMSYIGEDNSLAVGYLNVKKEFDATKEVNVFPCWSLAALLGVLPNGIGLFKTVDGEFYCLTNDYMTKNYDNPIDACVTMIEKLHKP